MTDHDRLHGTGGRRGTEGPGRRWHPDRFGAGGRRPGGGSRSQPPGAERAARSSTPRWMRSRMRVGFSSAVYRRSTLYSTLSPCDMCSGTALLYGIPRIVIGENQTFAGPEDYLRSRGVDLVILQRDRLQEPDGRIHRRQPGPLERRHRGVAGLRSQVSSLKQDQGRHECIPVLTEFRSRGLREATRCS